MDFHKEIDALLDNYWIVRENNSELYQKIKDKYPKFKDFIDNKLGAKLLINNYLIKLEKIPVNPEKYMGIPEFDDQLDYILFLLVLSFLEPKTIDEQFILSNLTSHIEMTFASLNTNDITLDWRLFKHRKSLVKVLNLVDDLGMIKVREGEVNNFAREISSEVLYESTGISRYMIRQFATNIHDCNNYLDIIEKETSNIDLNTGTLRRNYAYQRLTYAPLTIRNKAIVENNEEDYVFDYIIQYNNKFLKTDFENYLNVDLHVHRNMAMLLSNNERRYGEVFPSDKAICDIICLLCTLLKEKVNNNELSLNNNTIIVTKIEFKNLVSIIKDKYNAYFSKEFREMSIDLCSNQVVNYMESFNMLKIEENIIIYSVVFKYTASYISGGK